WLWVHERYDHIDDVPGGAKLPVCTRRGQLREEIFVHVSFEVMSVVCSKIEVVNTLHNGPQRRPIVYFQGGTIEQKLSGFREARQFVQLFDGVANRVEEIVAG